MVQKRKLNRGLEALLGSSVIAEPPQPAAETADTAGVTKPSAPLSEIPIEQLQRGVYQPRSEFEPEALDTLAASIKIPIIVCAICILLCK